MNVLGNDFDEAKILAAFDVQRQLWAPSNPEAKAGAAHD